MKENCRTQIVLILSSYFFILVVSFNCRGIPEYVSHGEYYITNNTTNKLIVEAFGTWGIGEVELLTNEINPGDKTHIYTFTEGSSGHVRPSNAWAEFYVYSETKNDSSIIYFGINDKDWVFEGASNDHFIYNLTIE